MAMHSASAFFHDEPEVVAIRASVGPCPLYERSRCKALVFDLDGTLVDNFDAIHAAAAHAMSALGVEPASHETVRRTVGGSIVVTMERLVGLDLRDQAIQLFKDHMNANWQHGLRLLPGALDLIKWARSEGLKTGLLTNKNSALTHKICRHLELDGLLDVVSGEGDTPWRKPHPGFTQHHLAHLKLESAACCFIGDSPFDAETARLVAMPYFLVATGSHTIAELGSEKGCSGIAKDLLQAKTWLSGNTSAN